MTLASPLLNCAGAVTDENWPVAGHYGNPLAEQRELVAGNAIIDLSHRGVITVHGPDRLPWLDSMLSQQVSTLIAGSSAEALLLDPYGHVEHAVRIVDDGQATWLLTDEGYAQSLSEFLNRMVFSADVDISDSSDEFATVGWFGDTPASIESLVLTSNDCAVIWHDPWLSVQEGGWQYSPTPAQAQWNYREGVIPREKLAELRNLVDNGRLSLAGLNAWEALRIAAWRPRIDSEGDEKLLPHEVDWLRTAVHLNKGCYRGQETVAKVHNIGHPPRRLVFLDLDGSSERGLEPGALIKIDNDDVVGRVTSVAMHWQEGPIALGLIKRNVDDRASLIVEAVGGDVVARQQVIVPRDAGATVSIPAELRQRNRE